jgi:hypothetical protein
MSWRKKKKRPWQRKRVFWLVEKDEDANGSDGFK